MHFFSRFFAPEIADLRRRLQFCEFERDQRCFERDNALAQLASLAKELKAEQKANQKREEVFLNRILQLTGAGNVPGREELATTTTPRAAEAGEKDIPPLLSDQQQNVLFNRAREMAEVRHGEAYSDAQVLQYFEEMKRDPENWLNDT